MHMVMLIPFEGTFGDRSFTLKRAVYRATRRPRHSDLWWCASVIIRTYQNSGPHLQPLESYSEENQGNKVVENEQSRNCGGRSEEHTSELQSRGHLVCRLLLEKKKKKNKRKKYKRYTKDKRNSKYTANK